MDFRRLASSSFLFIASLSAVLLVPRRTGAEEISPAIYIMVDTSGSMLADPDWNYCYGDGSVEHPHYAGRQSRIYMAKNAINTVVTGYPETRWGLARFEQNTGFQYLCLCSSQWDVDWSEEPDSCDLTPSYNYYYTLDLPSQEDLVCFNYGGGLRSGCGDWHTGVSLESADILVALAEDNEDDIISWIDHQETDPPAAAGGTGTDPELRAVGGTPLGGSLEAMYDQMSNTDLGADPRRGCRPYSVILLTDGDESCGGDPAAAAGSLRDTPDMAHSCSSNADCPPNTYCDDASYSPGRCIYDVKTYVIGFAMGDMTDVDNIAAAGGTGSAIAAWNEDDIVGAMAQIIAESFVYELCNGIDDDCDGSTDEDYPLGQVCNNGLQGICYAEGVYECDPGDDTAVVCVVDPATPVPGAEDESCNGLDDDCDGQIDEDGVCTCNGPELCNGLDDYCGTDSPDIPEGAEDSRVGQPCGTDVGQCVPGTTYCWVDPMDPTNVAIECNGTGPSAEVCDANIEANDQNCNGVNNDGVAPQPCVKSNVYGDCDGMETCDENGSWTCWAPEPAPESCNNVDDDCDGATDEALSRACQESNGFGTCTGTESCSAGSWVGCTAPTPAAETCDGVDNDCDGGTDENLTQPCDVSNGFGTCTGTESCSAGSWVGCTAKTPAAETCNDADDDCDGSTDEGLSQSCYTGPSGTQGVGLCQAGTQDCAAGSWGICNGEVTPTTEVCDSLDNDCDGSTDEDLGQTTCGLGECRHTVDNCVGGSTQSCDPMEGAQPESCDGLDNDCDGVTDGLSESCYPFGSGCVETSPGVWSCEGTCTTGTRSCPAGGGGSWGSCQLAKGPATETCDGQDNDCDGSTDESLTESCYPPGYGASTGCTAPGSCVGQCQEGTRQCQSGGWSSCGGAVTPSVEVCDNIDNDCDGQTDEGLTRPCDESNGYGTCTGIETCTAGSWGGCTAQTPTDETCDGVDNDCDGQTDEALTRSCDESNAYGTCSGTETCQLGGWVNCTARTPAAESCNDIDDDCDGSTDENVSRSCYTGPSGTEGVGGCQAGTQSCTSGTWSSCSGEVTPATESCDNVDNDCDGSTDEDLGQTTCGLGACEHTVENCVGGVVQTCDPNEGAQPESCDGVDNDCDGVVDGLTSNCYPYGSGCTETSPGVWSCEGVCRAGSRECPAGGSGAWGSCQLAQGPQTESCDNLDNDCDGQTDESLQQTCYPLGYGTTTGCTGPGSCLGTCQEGARVCQSGSWGSCQGASTPVAEVCDGQDNDCDGSTDEGVTRACEESNGFGTCEGVEACTNGVFGACTAQTPAAETCDSVDNDCDGATDENVTRSCYGGDAGTEGVGECHAGTETCTAGVWGSCSGEVVPSVEVCDGKDNDCDGATDEDSLGNPLSDTCYTGPGGTDGVGECRSGQRTCTNGSWGTCQNEATPSQEVCDGLDNDCDGQTDEELGQTTCGLGVCAHTVENCVNGVAQTCDPYEGATAEVCDGLDNDCDGVADGLMRTCYEAAGGCVDQGNGNWDCVGLCAPGIQICEAGSGVWNDCLYDVGPSEESCDNQDNDCDGATDEDAQGDPLSSPCYPPGSGLNTGCTYDATAVSWSCEGECASGTRVCTQGVWGSCSGHNTPAVESCNDLDDDCDGEIDEEEDIPGLNQPCGTALGRCTPGVLLCVDGQEICEGGEGPYEGVCNGQDDDCDGEIDEQDEVSDEEGQPCGSDVGACELGQTQCLGGEISCVGGIQPTEDVCDGVDNDCDGATDNGATCPPDYYCVLGDCRRVCDPGDEFSCPGTMDCQEAEVDGESVWVCLPSGGECGGETCPDGWICVDDECVDPCEGVSCESWEECRQGVCVDVSCSSLEHDCPAGEFCINHECVADPCLEADCAEDEFCLRDCDETACSYQCEPLCACAVGEVCTAEGTCVEDDCAEVECEPGERCNGQTGTCEEDPCYWVTCPGAEVCFDGECIADPCDQASCPPHHDCVVVEGSDGRAEPQCQADSSHWVDGVAGQELLATGAGGCHCRGAPEGSKPTGPILLLLLLGGLFAARRRDGGKGGAR